ncbi:MAG: fibronectin type III domain-containing protein, partial [Caldiserica bacterium]|nr:fibronectin type III domain-containing protein [Caldisericota bacterium]
MTRKLLVVLLILAMCVPFSIPTAQVGAATVAVPTKVEAHSFGTSVTVDWEYTYSPSPLTTLTFEVQWLDLPTMGIAGTVAYPTKTLTVDGLMTGEHKYRVRAVQTTTVIAGFPPVHTIVTTESNWSPFVSAWILTAPTGATVQRAGTTMGIKVQWTGLDPVATHYQILRTSVALMRAPVVHEGPHTDSSWADNDVDPNKKYYYYVRAVKAGTESADKDISNQSSAGSITTPPEAPASQIAYSSGRTISISWKHSGNCSQFRILPRPALLVGPVQPVLLPNTQRSYAIADAQYGKWTIDIAASGEGGYSPGTPQLEVWVLKTPPAPLSVVAGPTTVNLTWGSLDANATKVHVLRSASAGPFVDIKGTSSSVTSWADTTCLPGTAYVYRLQAMRDSDVSDLSPASLSVTTLAAPVPVPAAPTSLTAVAQSPTAVALTWTDNATNETTYRVYRRDGTHIVFGQVLPDLPPNTTSYQDTTVTPSSYYTYIIKVVNSAGESWSNEAAVTTPAAPVPVPAVPTNLVASAGAPTIVKLTWTDNATNESAYLVERAVGTGAFAALGSELSAGTTEWGDMNAVPSTSYRYRVKARNAGGDSPWSNEASVTTPSDVQTVVIKLIIDKKNYTINGISMMMDVAP